MKVGEIFSSIQGEGRFIGLPQVFVRLSGCNLRCDWCDTKEWWDKGTEMEVSQIIGKVRSFGIKSVCVTGGEPMLQADELLTLLNSLKKLSYFILLETNGTLYDKDIFDLADCVDLDIKPPSSGQESDPGIIQKLSQKDYVKIVIADEADYIFAQGVAEQSPIEVFFQPEGGVSGGWLSKRALKDRLDVRVMPQLHKIWDLK